MKKISYGFVLILLAVIALSINMFSVANVQAEVVKGLNSKSYIVIDGNGKILVENNSNEKREVASICKLMTTLLTLEEIEKGNISLDDKVVASKYACDAEGSQAFLDAGSEYLVRDLLKSVIVASANDSAIVLAEMIGGSEILFVDKMNTKAQELGMNNTLYANSTGLHVNSNQFSTAYDTAIILNKISEYEVYREDCKIWMDTLIHPSGRQTELVNTNRLIKYYPYCITGKTGFTDEAGYCLSSTAINNELKLTCVVLGCDSSADRFTDSVSLYNYAYANFASKKIIDKSIPIDNNIKIERGKEEEIIIVPEEDYYLTISKDSNENYSIKYIFEDSLKAPIARGDIVGKVQIIVDNNIVDEVKLISDVDVDKQNFKDILSKISDKFFIIN